MCIRVHQYGSEHEREIAAISNNIALPSRRRRRRHPRRYRSCAASKAGAKSRREQSELISSLHSREGWFALGMVTRYPGAHEGHEKYSRPWGRISRANLTLCAIVPARPRSYSCTTYRRLSMPTLDGGPYHKVVGVGRERDHRHFLRLWIFRYIQSPYFLWHKSSHIVSVRVNIISYKLYKLLKSGLRACEYKSIYRSMEHSIRKEKRNFYEFYLKL